MYFFDFDSGQCLASTITVMKTAIDSTSFMTEGSIKRAFCLLIKVIHLMFAIGFNLSFII